MGFLEQPFSTPIIYNREKGGNFVGHNVYSPHYNYSSPIIYNRKSDYIWSGSDWLDSYYL